jgi:hypothetical protein
LFKYILSATKLPEFGRKYKYKSRIGKHPNRKKRKLLLPKVYLYSNIHTEMQCGKVMAWNKICRLTAHSVSNITPWFYLVSGFFQYPSIPKQTQKSSETGSIFLRQMKGSRRNLVSWAWQMHSTLSLVQRLIDWKILNNRWKLTFSRHSPC